MDPYAQMSPREYAAAKIREQMAQTPPSGAVRRPDPNPDPYNQGQPPNVVSYRAPNVSLPNEVTYRAPDLGWAFADWMADLTGQPRKQRPTSGARLDSGEKQMSVEKANAMFGPKPAATPPPPPKAKGNGGGKPPAPVAEDPVDVNSVIRQEAEKIAADPLDPVKTLIKKYEEQPKKIDLSPLIALTDSWTGSNLKAGYDRPMNEEERDKVILQLREYVAKSEADQKYKQDYLAAMAKQNETRGQIAAANNATKLQVAEIRSHKGGTGGVSEAKLQKRWHDQLTQIASDVYVPKEVYGTQRTQQAKAKSALVHQHALAVGAEYERQGIAPKGLGYQTAVLHMLQTSDKGALAAAMGADDGKDDEDEED